MAAYALDLQELDQTQAALVGGKGANLGELTRIEGVRVPAGFCVTTDAFGRFAAGVPSMGLELDRLARLKPDEREAIRAASARLRQSIEETPIPDDLAAAITGALARFGEQVAWAVRSSATAEDSPTASFAGQHDTSLHVVGPAAVLAAVRRCWASLYTERALAYRSRAGLEHRGVRMAVVVQRMVAPIAAGVLFTADPVSGHRRIASVEASFGLGEALVSGRVNADVVKVRDGEVIARTIGSKRLVVLPARGGGTEEQPVAPDRQGEPALTDAQAVQLAALGRRIEAHFGCPQDIEWCLCTDGFHVVQSRPITTLFPIPAAADGENHVYLSVGHQQMMTDAMRPLGISLWQLTATRPMVEAGGRLFVDVTQALASPVSRAGLLKMVGTADPLIGDALRQLLDRGDFIPTPAHEGPAWTPPGGSAPTPLEADPALVAELIRRDQASIATLRRDIQTQSGPALFDFILADLQDLKRMLFDPQSIAAIMAGITAAWWLNEHMAAWLGVKNAADTLTRSVPDNVTSEMGLALLDVADALRPHPQVVAALRDVSGDGFLDDLPALPGGREARDAIQAWLDRYGMRGVGEIDITRPRWSERPTALVPLLLGHIENFEAGAAARRFEEGRQAAREMEQALLERLRALPDGAEKAAETKRMIDRVRTFAGYREYPKYGWICRYFVYKQALTREAERLVRSGVLHERGDIFYLTLQELHDVVRSQEVEAGLIRQRRDAFRSVQALTPPRVLTSDGEAIAGAYRREDLPTDALVGLAVSAGTVEGRARVVLDMAAADLGPGDILVTPFTDPSWTPLFVAIRGLVTEVGGLTTHGAVIAREVGLPAVVGVAHATRLIQDGQWIRVHGTDGYVEILAGPTGG